MADTKTQDEKSNEKHTILLVVLLLVAGLFIAFALTAWGDKGDEEVVEVAPVACTMEVLECPDGTFVGRTGPNCEFETCPNGEAVVPPVAEEELVACTMDVQECPDGTFVGRVGPDCEFAECPGY